MPVHLLHLGFPEASKRLKGRDEGTFLDTCFNSSKRSVVSQKIDSWIACSGLPYRGSAEAGEGRVQSPSLLLVRWGAPIGIKKSFFHGKPNQKGKALLMMGGSRGVRGRR